MRSWIAPIGQLNPWTHRSRALYSGCCFRCCLANLLYKLCYQPPHESLSPRQSGLAIRGPSRGRCKFRNLTWSHREPAGLYGKPLIEAFLQAWVRIFQLRRRALSSFPITRRSWMKNFTRLNSFESVFKAFSRSAKEAIVVIWMVICDLLHFDGDQRNSKSLRDA